MKWTVKINNRDFATIYKNGKEIECLSGLFCDETDKKDLRELVNAANRLAALQAVAEAAKKYIYVTYPEFKISDLADSYGELKEAIEALSAYEQAKAGAK